MPDAELETYVVTARKLEDENRKAAARARDRR